MLALPDGVGRGDDKGGRAEAGAAPRAASADRKWEMGDAAARLPDGELWRLAAGYGVSESQMKSYRRVALAWPADRRVDAPWTVHRELADVENRFDLIRPGMTMRRARAAAGKTPIDTKPKHRRTQDEKVEEVLELLAERGVRDEAHARLSGSQGARKALRVMRMAEEEQDADLREARRQLKLAMEEESPDVAAHRALEQVRSAVDVVRQLTPQVGALVPGWMRPQHAKAAADLLEAARALDLAFVEPAGSIGRRSAATTVVDIGGSK